MMTLGLNEGEKIVIEADGKDEAAAVEGVEKYITGQEA